MTVKTKNKSANKDKVIASDGALLEEVISAHGGADILKKYSKIRTSGAFGGWLLFRTPLRKTARLFTREPSIYLKGDMEISLCKHQLIVSPFPEKGYMGIYNENKVSILNTKTNETVSKIVDRKEIATRIFWNNLDLLYFAAYGNSYYYQSPFIFGQEGFETYELEPVFEYEQEFRRLLVVHPEGWPIHCREIIYCIGKDGLIHHFRYNIDISGDNAKIIHFVSEYIDVSGYKLPKRRIAFLEGEPFKNFRRKSRMPCAGMDVYNTKIELIP